MASEIDLAVESILKESNPQENFFTGGYNFFPKEPSHAKQAAANLFHSRMFCADELTSDVGAPNCLPLTLKSEKVEPNPTTPTPVTTRTESAAPKPIRVTPAQLNSIVDGFLDEAILGVVLELHRSAKSGALAAEEGIEERQESQFKIANVPYADIFGQNVNAKPVKQWECVCPKCNRPLAALRFAPHLEKCMGMGRSSSRQASRRTRTTNISATHSGAVSSSEAHGSTTRLGVKSSSNSDWTSNMAGLEESDDEEEDDDDWLSTRKSRDRATKRRRTVKNTVTVNGRVKRPAVGRTAILPKKSEGGRLHSVASAPTLIDYSKLGTERTPGEVGPVGFHFSSEIFDTESVDYYIGGGSEVTALIGDDNFTFEGDTAEMMSDRSTSGLSHEPEVVWSTVPGSGSKLKILKT